MAKNDYIKEIEIACGVSPEDVSQSHFAPFGFVDRDLNVKIQAIRNPGPPPNVFVGLVCDSRDGSAIASVREVVRRLGARGTTLGLKELHTDIHGRIGREFQTVGRTADSLAIEAKTFIDELKESLEA